MGESIDIPLLRAFDRTYLRGTRAAGLGRRLIQETSPTVSVRDLDLTVDFAAGEEMRTEVSAKFRHEAVAAELERAGMRLTHWWTDPGGDFALSLSEPA